MVRLTRDHRRPPYRGVILPCVHGVRREANSAGPRSDAVLRRVDNKRFLIGLDDTDNAMSRGTGLATGEPHSIMHRGHS